VLGQYLFYPDSFSFNFDLATFALFVPLALIFTAIQTTTEELFFRGYVVQGASMISTNRVFLALVAAVVFTLPHLLNPEVSAGGWLTVFSNYFLVPGLLWTVVSLIDGTTELAIGLVPAYSSRSRSAASRITPCLVLSGSSCLLW
jgi:membrane protease YdiL (CAAX protease family)